jgi:phage baseplate assembly protein W
MLILTNPGEKMMDSSFGVGLKSYLFELNNPQTYSTISAKIRSQVAKYLDYIEINDITFDGPFDNPSRDKNSLFISIRYQLLPLSVDDVLNFTEEVE